MVIIEIRVIRELAKENEPNQDLILEGIFSDCRVLFRNSCNINKKEILVSADQIQNRKAAVNVVQHAITVEDCSKDVLVAMIIVIACNLTLMDEPNLAR